MTRKISAVTARTQFGQIVDRADFVKTSAPAPEWLRDIQNDAKRKGLDELTMTDIDAEITAARRERVRSAGS